MQALMPYKCDGCKLKKDIWVNIEEGKGLYDNKFDDKLCGECGGVMKVDRDYAVEEL